MVHRSEGEGRGGEKRGAKVLHTYKHTDGHTDPPTKRVLEEHSLLKIIYLDLIDRNYVTQVLVYIYKYSYFHFSKAALYILASYHLNDYFIFHCSVALIQ